MIPSLLVYLLASFALVAPIVRHLRPLATPLRYTARKHLPRLAPIVFRDATGDLIPTRDVIDVMPRGLTYASPYEKFREEQARAQPAITKVTQGRRVGMSHTSALLGVSANLAIIDEAPRPALGFSRDAIIPVGRNRAEKRALAKRAKQKGEIDLSHFAWVPSAILFVLWILLEISWANP